MPTVPKESFLPRVIKKAGPGAGGVSRPLPWRPWWPPVQISADPSKSEVAAVAALPGQSRMHPVCHTQSLL